MKPMLATRGETVPRGPEWVHEVKWDGVRVLVDCDGSRLRIFSRNENDVTAAYPELRGLADVGRDFLLDGEVIALADGVPSFAALAERMHLRDARKVARLAETNPVTLVVFDLLRLDGVLVVDRPLRERRALLDGLGLPEGCWQVPPEYDDGTLLLEVVRQRGLEGIVSKRLSSPYHPGRRSRDWVKFPIRPTGSYVVGGFRRETGSDTRLGAVLVGTPTDGGLRYRGKVGSGIAGRVGQRLRDVLEPLAVDRSPFVDEVPRADRQGTTWVVPEVVVDVQYLAVTGEGRLRQPAYRGERSDITVADLGEGE
ncbi:MAG TPA: non-homologous end-joining DNA ligase [Marmoricola sp.]|jgi:bifunctional non-homologous end joining protein LigD|nr:non-homologous end-joining DNA ligase [Marmoricola sp.]